MPDWPDTLPCPVMAMTESRQPNIAAFKPDVGPPKQRRRSTAVGVDTSIAFRMTNTQLDTFDDFFVNDLADGTLPFTMNHPRTTISYDWTFTAEAPPSIERFAPNASRVTVRLIRLP